MSTRRASAASQSEWDLRFVRRAARETGTRAPHPLRRSGLRHLRAAALRPPILEAGRRTSRRSAGLLNRTRGKARRGAFCWPAERPPPPFSQAVRSGLLRLISAWSPVRGAKRNGAPEERGAAPSEASQSGPPDPVRFWRAGARSFGLRLRRPHLRPRCGLRLLGESFRAVKVKILRLQSGYAVYPRAQRQIGLRKRAPASHVSGT